MIEEWKSVPGLEAAYEASSLGRLRSKDRIDCANRPRKGQLLKTSVNRKGYVIARISWNKRKRTVKLARLVAQLFVPNPQGLPQVNHLDGDKANDRATNLEWETNSGNTQHAYDTGLKPKRYGAEADAVLYRYEVIDSRGVVVDTLCGNREMKAKGYQGALIRKVIIGERPHHRGMTFKHIPL